MAELRGKKCITPSASWRTFVPILTFYITTCNRPPRAVSFVHHSECTAFHTHVSVLPGTRSMRAGLDALPDDVLLQLIKACSRDTPDAGGMPELEVSSVLPLPRPLTLTTDH